MMLCLYFRRESLFYLLISCHASIISLTMPRLNCFEDFLVCLFAKVVDQHLITAHSITEPKRASQANVQCCCYLPISCCTNIQTTIKAVKSTLHHHVYIISCALFS